MKYSVLLNAVAMRGRQSKIALDGGRIREGDHGAVLPRPHGVMLAASMGRVIGGSKDGMPVVVATEEAPVPGEFGARTETTTTYAGYDDQAEAYQDVLRLVVAVAVKDGSFLGIAGWGGDAVILLPGVYGGGYIVRVASPPDDPSHSNLYECGEIASEDKADLGNEFAEAIDELIEDLSLRAKELSSGGRVEEAEVLADLALSWLRKEAAQHRAASARQHFLAAADPSSGMVGPNAIITMSELARNLYTDRGNLTRTINQALAEETT